jgi:hypothetical protein
MPTRNLPIRLVSLCLLGVGIVSAADEAPAPVAPLPRSQPAATGGPAGVMQSAYQRPRQVTEVCEVESAEDLATKIKVFIDSGVMITSVTPVTANGKTMVVLIGMPAARPPVPMNGQPVRPQAPSVQILPPAAPQPAPAKP